jgi:hypothetical protein
MQALGVSDAVKRPDIMKSRISLIFLVLAFLSGCSDMITPHEMTRTAMAETFVRINFYAETNKSIPPSLDVLPKREGYANRTTDGWNRPLLYRVSQDGIITLTSLGGDGENAGISMSYRSKRKDGSLWAGSPTWITDAEVK